MQSQTPATSVSSTAHVPMTPGTAQSSYSTPIRPPINQAANFRSPTQMTPVSTPHQQFKPVMGGGMPYSLNQMTPTHQRPPGSMTSGGMGGMTSTPQSGYRGMVPNQQAAKRTRPPVYETASIIANYGSQAKRAKVKRRGPAQASQNMPATDSKLFSQLLDLERPGLDYQPSPSGNSRVHAEAADGEHQATYCPGVGLQPTQLSACEGPR